MRGAGLPALAAAPAIAGTMCDSSVRGPTHAEIVPSASAPVTASACAPSAATSTGTSALSMPSSTSTSKCSPWNETGCRRAAVAAPRGIRAASRSATRRPSAARIIDPCDIPMPSVRRPPSAACAVRAPCAIATGWRGGAGTIAVPSSIVAAAWPATASAVSGSMPQAMPIHMPSSPAASISAARAVRPATMSSAGAPTPTATPILTCTPRRARLVVDCPCVGAILAGRRRRTNVRCGVSAGVRRSPAPAGHGTL